MQTMQDKHDSTALAPVHLVVLQHGLWGNTTCVSNLEAFLIEHLNPQSNSSTSTAAQGTSTNHAAAGDTDSTAKGTEESSTGPWFTAAAAGSAGTAKFADGATAQKAEVQILNSDVNRKALTYDGIDVCGARVVKVVLDSIQLLQASERQVTQLSFVGYSLGGLILRYAVGKLYVLGLFEEVQCANFITIATPHLGSWRAPTSFWARFFNSHVAVVGSRTGRQLMLADADYTVPWLNQQQQQHEQAHAEHTAALNPQQRAQQKPHIPLQQQQQQQQEEGAAAQAELPPGVSAGQAVPLLLLMAHPSGPFHKALAGFRTRMVAANIKYDAMVPYCTAALRMSNPYEEQEAVSVDPDRYPSVVRPACVGEQGCTPLTYKGRTKRLLLFALFSPFAPLLYIWTVTYGVLHHRSARRKVLEGSWLTAPAAAAAAPAAARGLTSSSSSSRAASKQPLGSTRTAAMPGTADAAAGDVADAADDLQELITTAVEAGSEGSERSPFEAGMQAVAAETATAEVLPAAEKAPEPAAAAAAAQEGPGSTLSRRFSDSLAAAVQHHRQEDELGQLTKQLSSKGLASSKGRIKLGFSSSGSARADAALPAPLGTQELDPTAAAAAAAAAAAGGSALGLARSASKQAAAAAGAEERVTVDRDGIVEAPSLLHQQQAWMAQQLFDAMPPCTLPDNTCTAASSSTAGPGCVATHVKGPADVAADSSSAGGVQQEGGSAVGVREPQQQQRPQPQQQQQQPQPQQQQQQVGTGSTGSSTVTTGGWHRVDVCTRHWHAHAAIIIRDYRFKDQSKDVFQYLVDHMSL